MKPFSREDNIALTFLSLLVVLVWILAFVLSAWHH